MYIYLSFSFYLFANNPCSMICRCSKASMYRVSPSTIPLWLSHITVQRLLVESVSSKHTSKYECGERFIDDPSMTSSQEIANKEKWKRHSACLSNQRISSGPHRSWNAEVPEQAPVFVHIKCWSSWPGGGSSVLCTPILRICRFWVKISPDHVWKRVSSQDFVGFWIDLVVECPFGNPRWRCRGMKGQRTVDPCHCSFPLACSLRQTTWCY